MTDPGELLISLERQLKPYTADLDVLAAALPEQVVRDLLIGYLDLMFEV